MEDDMQVFEYGPPTGTCKCDCSTGGPCEHVWDGPSEDIYLHYEEGGLSSSSTCSKCGVLTIAHDLWVCPRPGKIQP